MHFKPKFRRAGSFPRGPENKVRYDQSNPCHCQNLVCKNIFHQKSIRDHLIFCVKSISLIYQNNYGCKYLNKEMFKQREGQPDQLIYMDLGLCWSQKCCNAPRNLVFGNICLISSKLIYWAL